MQERRQAERILLNVPVALQFIFADANEQSALVMLADKLRRESFDTDASLS